MIVVDSSVWIDYFNGISTWQTETLDALLPHVPIIMGDLIFTEVLQGFRSDSDYEKAKSYFEELPFRDLGGYEVALMSVSIYRGLRKKGITVRKTIDVIIAAFCMVNELMLLHDDKHFTPISDYFSLRVILP